MNRMRQRYLLLISALLLSTALTAQPAAPGSGDEQQAPNQQLQLQVEQAYRNCNQYQAQLDYHFDSKAGRWKRDERGEFFIAFDRINQRLKIDAPGVLVVIKDGKLYISSADLMGRYLEAEAPDPLTYANLIEATTIRGEPLIANPLLLDVAFLLGDDPILEMTEWTEESAEVLPPVAGSNQPRLKVDLFAAATTMSIDPKTYLIVKATDDTDMTVLTGSDATADYQKKHYTYTIEKHNQPIAESEFDFDPQGARRFTSFETMVADIFGSSDGSASGSSTATSNSQLQSQDAANFEIKDLDGNTVKLEDLIKEHKIVLLDFWATWCPPCRMALPEMEKLQDWAVKNNKPVRIFTINAGEDQYTIQNFWDQNNMTLPVLLDADGSIMEQYQVSTIPHTFIIVDGKIEHIHAGYVENMSDVLASKIEELLAPKPEPEPQSQNTPNQNQSQQDSKSTEPSAPQEPQPKPTQKPKRAPAAPL